MSCELCERQVQPLTVHHLIPRQKKGDHGSKINICSACHKLVRSIL
ncbi:HNH endonuclease [Brasilonema bromeliae]|uniref:HNH domain-containing protein n=1 Tax=Brasilonema bromeliae SPC951 TaxID=385972 RepID=A0ABX1PCJ2_9CYAN|nr:HNH endonuclease [Brasilonema bromeliae]NMG22086.1 hypothetical protein [Brasilonema bromeliae SPC951]